MKIVNVNRDGIEIVVSLVNYEETESHEIRLSEQEAENLISAIHNLL